MEYLGPVWLADVWPADDIPFCSIVTYFHAILFPYWKKAHFFSESECYSKSTILVLSLTQTTKAYLHAKFSL